MKKNENTEPDTAPQEDTISEPPTDVKTLSVADQVGYLAGLQFTRTQVETIIGQTLDDELKRQYTRGALLEEAKIREAIKRLAIQGSSPAQKQYMDMIARAKKANIGKV